MECYICFNNMKYLGIQVIELLGECKVYECPKCKEIVYETIKN